MRARVVFRKLKNFRTTIFKSLYLIHNASPFGYIASVSFSDQSTFKEFQSLSVDSCIDDQFSNLFPRSRSIADGNRPKIFFILVNTQRHCFGIEKQFFYWSLISIFQKMFCQTFYVLATAFLIYGFALRYLHLTFSGHFLHIYLNWSCFPGGALGSFVPWQFCFNMKYFPQRGYTVKHNTTLKITPSLLFPSKSVSAQLPEPLRRNILETAFQNATSTVSLPQHQISPIALR